MKQINNDIQESYCSFEVSKLLKEKRFECKVDNFNWYDSDGDNLYTDGEGSYKYHLVGECIAPTHSLAIEWMRVNFEIDIHSEWSFTQDGIRFYVYHIDGKESDKCYKTPQEAIEAALKYTLENLIS